MRDSIVRMRLMIVLVLGLSAVGIWGSLLWQVPPTENFLSVSFLDVGQGDAIFIETPSGAQVLIDGGPNSSVLRVLAQEMGAFDRTIDVVIPTHPDTDHIGGLIDVLNRYDASTILRTENKGESSAAGIFDSLVEAEGADTVYARRGQVLQLDASTTLQVLFPETDARTMENNTSSIIVQLRYGESTFLLTGDAPKSIEEYLVLVEGEHLQSDVLKVGHHGSRTSTSELFLNEVNPQYAVISAGRDNRYGHPHTDVTDLLFNNGIEILQTAQEGTITFLSDGKEIWVE